MRTPFCATLLMGAWACQPALAAAPVGDLFIDSVPQGAAILVDGVDSGYFTPTVLRDLPIGPHRIELAAGCLVAASAVELAPAVVTRVELELELGRGTLELSSAPAGAQLGVDGEVLGKTPLRADLACGEHMLLLELEGYHPLSHPGSLGHGEFVSLALDLQPIEYGRLVVVPDPLDARVLLDGEGVGRGALTLDGIVAGPHEVEVKASGLAPQLRTVQVHKDKIARLELSLVNPFPGTAGEPQVGVTDASQLRSRRRGRMVAGVLAGVGAGFGAHAGVSWWRLDAAYADYMGFSREGPAEAFYDDNVAPVRTVLVVDLAAAVALLGAGGWVLARSSGERVGADGGAP